jgi:hypothetical protein
MLRHLRVIGPAHHHAARTAARELPMPQVAGGQHDACRCLALGNRWCSTSTQSA